MSKKEVSLTQRIRRENVIESLDELINGLRQETVCIQSSDDFVTLKPSSVIKFEIEAVAKKDKEKLKIELSWSHDKALKEKAFSITPIEVS